MSHAALNVISPGLKFTSADGSITTERKAEGFVDDTDLWVTSTALPDDNPGTVTDGMQQLFQCWCTVLRQSGGLLGFKKCFWCLITWVWHKGKARMAMIAETPGNMRVDTEDEQGMVAVTRLEANKGMPTLGVRLAPDCNQADEHKCRLEQSRTMGRLIFDAPLSRREVETAHNDIWWMRIGYPLSVTTFTKKECNKTQAAFQSKFLARMGCARNLATETCHGPLEHGGVGIKTIWNEQGLKKILLVPQHTRHKEEVGDSMLVALSNAQVESGIGKQIMMTDRQHFGKHTTNTWVTQAWEWLAENDLQVHMPDLWTPQPHRINDRFIVEHAATLCSSQATLEASQRCRSYLKISHFSEIFDATGKYLLPETWKGHPHKARTATIEHPNQARPPPTDWTTFRKFLKKLLTDEDNRRTTQTLPLRLLSVKPQCQLGPWLPSHTDTWTTTHSPNTDKLHRQEQQGLHACSRRPTGRATFLHHSRQQAPSLPDDALPITINNHLTMTGLPTAQDEPTNSQQFQSHPTQP